MRTSLKDAALRSNITPPSLVDVLVDLAVLHAQGRQLVGGLGALSAMRAHQHTSLRP